MKPSTAILVAAALLGPSALPAADYCVDAASGSDSASGLCSQQAWKSLAPTYTFAFQPGDQVLIGPGSYRYDRTGWYMFPQVNWIGAGADETEIVYTLSTEVPFVRFRTGSQGSGPPWDRRAGSFGPDTVLSGMTLRNAGGATIGVEVKVTADESSPTIRDVHLTGFPVGIALHPSTDEKAAATTRATLTRNMIRGSSETGVLFYADVFYSWQVTEASTLVNTMVDSGGVGTDARTLINYDRNFDPADAAVRPVLTHNTIRGETGSAARLVSYLDDGYGRRLALEEAGAFGPTFTNDILTGSDRYGLEETSPFTEPLSVTGNDLGGNALGDYLDEGATPVGAGSVGTGNTSQPPLFVDPAAGDLHQLATSPTVDRVAAAEAPADDVDRQTRPQGAAADIGADEFVACSAVADASASEVPPPCTGGSVVLDGSDSQVDAVCAAGLLYAWYDGDTLLGTGVRLPYDPPAAGTVTLRVRCADPALSACRGEADVPVTPPTPAVFAEAGPDVVLAVGESARLGGTPTGSGGTPPFRYAWIPDPPELDTGADAANPLFTPSSSGITEFTVTVTDQQGCSAQDVVTATVVPPLSADAGPDRSVNEGDATMLGGTPAASGGETPYSYSWSPIQGLDDPTAERPLFTTSAPGDFPFTLTVRDAAGRTASDEVVVSVAGVDELLADAGADRTIRLQEQTVLGGQPAASGGVAPYTYSWSPSQDLDRSDADRPTFTPSSTGDFTFTLTVQDDRGATAQDPVTVRVVDVPPLAAEAGPDRTITLGDRTVLGGSPTGSGGLAPLTYEWTPTPPGFGEPAVANPTFTPASTGAFVFQVIVRDRFGDTAGDSVTVTVQDASSGSAPGEVPWLRVRDACGPGGAVEVSFQPAPRADFHRLYAGPLGGYPTHDNLASPQGCDDPAAPPDPDEPFLFRHTDGCAPGGSFYYLVVGVNDAGEGSYGREETDGDPLTEDALRPPGIPACP